MCVPKRLFIFMCDEIVMRVMDHVPFVSCANGEIRGILAASVFKVMTCWGTCGPTGKIACMQDTLFILDKDHLTRQHINHLILSFVPMMKR